MDIEGGKTILNVGIAVGYAINFNPRLILANFHSPKLIYWNL